MKNYLSLRMALLAVVTGVSMTSHAAVSVSPGGQPGYSISVSTPPGRGPEPSISINYTGGRNGSVGTGWSLNVGAQITRCAGIKAIDGMPGTINFMATDKLCFNGARLIALDGSGNPVTGLASRDAEGLGASAYREFRVETDSRTRVRAYGMVGTSGETGPQYFQVWQADGSMAVLGKGPDDFGSNALVVGSQVAYAKTGMTWLVSEMRDRHGNSIRFFYDQASYSLGTNVGGTDGYATPGLDVVVREIQYGPGNKVVFSYSERADTPGAREETLYRGNKSVSVRLLNAISTYVNAPTDVGSISGAVHAQTTRLSYDTGTVSGRPRLKDARVCTTPAGGTCLPATSFTYTEGGPTSYSEVAGLNLPNDIYSPLGTSGSPSGAVSADFDNDGKTDLLKISVYGSPRNVIYRSLGNGQFATVIDPVIANERFTVESWPWPTDCRIDVIVRDFNGDGRPDIFRFVNKYEFVVGENPCPSMSSALYLNLPSGFVKKDVTGFPQRFREWYPEFFQSEEGPSPYKGWGAAENFFLLDLNGDGILDVITSKIEGKDFAASTFDLCPSGQCTRAFLGNGEGGFSEVPTNLAPYPMIQLGYTGLGGSATVDLDADGLSDLIVMDPRSEMYSGAYSADFRWADIAISRGDGNFDFKKHDQLINSVASAMAFDSQGDGQLEVRLTYSGLNGGGTYVWSLPDPLFSVIPQPPWKGVPEWIGDQPLAGGGYPVLLDFNGDGRSDSLFLIPRIEAVQPHEEYLQVMMQLSKGNNQATQDRAFNIPLNKLGTMQNGMAGGTYKRQMFIGNFTGKSSVEVLSLGDVASGETSNALYTPDNPIPPDRLLTVREGAAGVTSITYQPAAATDRVSVETSADTGQVSVAPSGVIVTALSSPSGVPGQPSVTEYAYAGQRADKNGRGSLGYRIFKSQTDTPNGRKMTSVTRFSQSFPYVGMPMSTRTVLSSLAVADQGQVLMTKEFAYCDAANDAGARDALIAGAGNCAPVVSPIKRTYARLVRSVGYDLDGSVMPTQTITTDVNGAGYPTTVATIASLNGQLFRSTETTSYLADDAACSTAQVCRWWIARPDRVTVSKSAPNVLPTVVAGNEPLATGINGTVPNVPQGPQGLPAALVAAMWQILADD
ncbi:hypothetical protein CDN99_20050 [Roseateles aquatilis]|uniref:Insecticide toxin TcdB middle/N-terminal domain-containing protein n=2 Tax=Roseateles aquatilis TaxID=431061 RepID=A0A246J315_9BURK|nr:hypothetical protein CDN99_20050 [Roseateles aquatilis]